ncbi:MAG: glutamine synthetase family protein [Pseudomonadota bacterium]
MKDWLAEHPHILAIRAAVADVNGQPRGKRLPARAADKALAGQMRAPLSVVNVDIRGDDIADSPLLFETGDRDGLLKPTDRGFVPMPWLDTPTALLPMWMHRDDGTPFAGDPRHALATVLKRYAARHWQPICATELEFYLIDDSDGPLRSPASPRSGKRRIGGEILSIRALDAFDSFFTDLYAACEAMGISAEAASSEAGLAQFEVNLTHGPAMRIADDTWLFKLLTKGLARKHGFAASFMAKPYPDDAGTGMHLHFSVLDRHGRNVFDDGTEKGSDRLQQAVAGCLDAMADSALIFAPHGNSYDRLVPGAHAPTSIAWAYENRTAALRVPSGPGNARRIEHRVAGGDVNPYLLIAAVLGGAMIGIDDELTPPPPITGNAYELQLPQIPTDWDNAIGRFEHSGLMKRIFPRELLRNYTLTKRQERQTYATLSPEDRIATYLDTV